MIALMKFLAMAAGIVSLLTHVAGRVVGFADRAILDPPVYDSHAALRG
jgi:hypothetical protein